MKLNKKQKQFMFEHYYVDAKCLDACVEPGWKDFFINCFDWKLEDLDTTGGGQQIYGHLRLIDKGDLVKEAKGNVVYDITVIFQDNDYEKLTDIH